MTILLLMPFFLWALIFGLNLLGTWLVWQQFKNNDTKRLPVCQPPISILKPLKGIDVLLKSNLQTYFMVDYPQYELIFSAAHAQDPALQTVQKLMEQFPRIDASVIVANEEVGPNPKVNNLVMSYKTAKYDHIVISDSNTKVDPNYLKHLVASLDAQTGIVTSVVVGEVNELSLGALLEATYLNTFFARWMHLTAYFGTPCVVGKTMFFRRSTMNRFGGLANLGRYLAEDYMSGIAMQYLGYKVNLNSAPIIQPLGQYSIKDFWQRHLRWGRIRKAQARLAFLAEPLSFALLSAMCCGLGFHLVIGINFSVGFIVSLGSSWLCDIVVVKLVSGRLDWKIALTWFMREIVALPLWVHTLTGNKVVWKGNILKVENGGTLSVSLGSGHIGSPN